MEHFCSYENLLQEAGSASLLRAVATLYDFQFDEICKSEYLEIPLTNDHETRLADHESTIPSFTGILASDTSYGATKSDNENTTQTAIDATEASPSAVKFMFRTPDNTKFSDSNFKISFVTNSKSLTYRISGQSEQYSIPSADISAGVHTIRLPKRSCELTIIDEAQKFHVLNFIYDEDRDLRKSSTLHILAIGVNNYPAQNLNSLKYAEADAKAVVDAFVSRHKYTFGNINKTILLGNNVSCQSIEREIDNIADTAKSNDLAIIFLPVTVSSTILTNTISRQPRQRMAKRREKAVSQQVALTKNRLHQLQAGDIHRCLLFRQTCRGNEERRHIQCPILQGA